MELKIRNDALKYWKSQDAPTRERLKRALENLAEHPDEGDIAPIVGHYPLMRLRVGGFRVIFCENGDAVEVLRIAPRGQAYHHL